MRVTPMEMKQGDLAKLVFSPALNESKYLVFHLKTHECLILIIFYIICNSYLQSMHEKFVKHTLKVSLCAMH